MEEAGELIRTCIFLFYAVTHACRMDNRLPSCIVCCSKGTLEDCDSEISAFAPVYYPCIFTITYYVPVICSNVVNVMKIMKT